MYTAFEFYPHLTPDQRARFDGATRLASYAPGQVIHSPEVRCQGLLVVESGALRVYMLSDQGRDVTLYRLHAGEVCVLSASCVLSEIAFDVYIEATEPTQVQLTQVQTFKALVEENVYVRCFAYQLSTARFSDVMWSMQQLLFLGVDKRLAIWLADEAARTGSDEVVCTQQEAASAIGSAREVVSRTLKELAERGFIATGRGRITITNKAGLQALARA
jgi:CRP/FNR family transcriptional regulator